MAWLNSDGNVVTAAKEHPGGGRPVTETTILDKNGDPIDKDNGLSVQLTGSKGKELLYNGSSLSLAPNEKVTLLNETTNGNFYPDGKYGEMEIVVEVQGSRSFNLEVTHYAGEVTKRVVRNVDESPQPVFSGRGHYKFSLFGDAWRVAIANKSAETISARVVSIYGYYDRQPANTPFSGFLELGTTRIIFPNHIARKVMVTANPNNSGNVFVAPTDSPSSVPVKPLSPGMYTVWDGITNLRYLEARAEVANDSLFFEGVY